MADAVYYTVQKGDYLIKIANMYGTTYQQLAKINNISNPNLIYVGQKLLISGDGEPSVSSNSNNSNKANITAFGLQADTTNTLFAMWSWSKTNTENYEYYWYYTTRDDVEFIGNKSTTEETECTYNYPENAKKVRFKVKPISKQKTVNNSTTYYWTAEWSTDKTYDTSDRKPETPSSPPSIERDKYKLTATYENLDVDEVTGINATGVEYQVLQDYETEYATGKAEINNGRASYAFTLAYGHSYVVRARFYNTSTEGEWSSYTSEIETPPDSPTEITSLYSTSSTSVYLAWSKVDNATSYKIEYTEKVRYFDNSSNVTTVSNISEPHWEVTGIEAGKELYFRIRAVNSQGESEPTDPKSLSIGKTPSAPTTWSSTTVAYVSGPLILYWVHNSRDGSSQTYAQLELTQNGITTVTTIKNEKIDDEDHKDDTLFYEINTSSYNSGTSIQWRVRTSGVTNEFGEWSVVRTVDIYAQPVMTLSVNSTITEFPIAINATITPSSQSPTGYTMDIISNSSYETISANGEVRNVTAGEIIFEQYYDTQGALSISLTPSNIDLENGASYSILMTAGMNSGLMARATKDFTVAFDEISYVPNAEVSFNKSNYSMTICPYCENEDGVLIDDTYLNIYRKNYDGTYTSIGEEIQNDKATYVTDPYPELKYARYRVVSVSKTTGAISYYDIPDFPVKCPSIIIQWNDKWSNFRAEPEDISQNATFDTVTGSLLKLDYDIDVPDSTTVDKTTVKYAGREYPVSYYGTHINTTVSMKTNIPYYDIETIYQLRRLSIWKSDVYIREPSGTGYKATIDVSFDQTHNELTIPVTLQVTRVE